MPGNGKEEAYTVQSTGGYCSI